MAQVDDPRTVLQAHRLRTQLASSALVHGDRPTTVKAFGVKAVIMSVVLAALILGGIIVAGYVIDLFNSGALGRRGR